MSWNGTVRCTNCYKTGHNRRTCPTLSAAAKTASPPQERTCAWCVGKGHDTRKCPEIPAFKSAALQQLKTYRARWANDVVEAGLVAGTLIERPRYIFEKGYAFDMVSDPEDGYDPPLAALGMVSEIKWDEVAPRHFSDAQGRNVSSLVMPAIRVGWGNEDWMPAWSDGLYLEQRLFNYRWDSYHQCETFSYRGSDGAEVQLNPAYFNSQYWRVLSPGKAEIPDDYLTVGAEKLIESATATELNRRRKQRAREQAARHYRRRRRWY